MNAIDDAITFSGLRRRTSTRLVFCMSGVALGTWAPLVPIVKARLSVDEATFGLLLLCMGLGSILIMPVTGYLTSRFGCRVIVTFAFACLCLILPVLTIIKTPMIMAAALVGFGMAMGCNSVAINLQAVLVERHSGKSLMSGFHALFSLGGIAGSGIASAMLSSGISGTTAALVGSAAIAILLIVAREGILAISNDDGERSPAFVVPRGIVVVIGLLALIAMLCEGAILDWGALFLIRAYDTDLATAGFGYTAFATMMTLGRLIGDRVRTRFGDTRILTWSAVLSTIGFLISLASPLLVTGLVGFMLIGIGLSNIIPILFTLTGRTRSMPANLALSAVFTVGYAGIIAGPAAIGFVAHAASLQSAFWILCGAVAIIAITARAVAARI